MDAKQAINETLGIIDAAMTILNKFPGLDESNSDFNISFTTALNPFAFLMELFKHTEGYDVLLNIIGKFIAYELPILEVAVKAILANTLKDMISCSVNPIITKDLLINGVVLSVDEISLIDSLRYSPLDQKVGKYFYFDNDVEYTAALTRSKDLDCLIWYVINKANRRYTWSLNPKKISEDRQIGEEDKLKDAIITLEYSENGSDVKDAEHNDYYRQIPFNNCLHVFIGDTRPDLTPVLNLEQEVRNCEAKIKEANDKIKELNKENNKKKAELDNVYIAFEKNKINEEQKFAAEEPILERISNIATEINDNENIIEAQTNLKNEKLVALEDASENLEYRQNENIKLNYFYKRTLIEFNAEYILSLKLFDAKVIAAKLLDSLTNMLSINLGLSYKQQIIQNAITKMVNMVIENDDVIVPDCFFTFSNEEYDKMYRNAELNQAGLVAVNGEEAYAVNVNAEEILKSINQIDSTAKKETIQTIVSGAIIDVSKQLTIVDYNNYYDYKDTFGIQNPIGHWSNILEKLLSSLANVIVGSIFTPKVYMLILINLKIMGEGPKFNLDGFIQKYVDLIIALIKEIRDHIIQLIYDFLMEILKGFAEEIAKLMVIEQAEYYIRLIRRMIACFRFSGGNIGWNMDNVDYADIVNDEEQTPPEEC